MILRVKDLINGPILPFQVSPIQVAIPKSYLSLRD